MTRRQLTVAFVMAVLLFAASGAQAAGITWGNSLDQAIKIAKRTNKPILIDLYADWCGWCKRLDADVYTDPQVIKTASQFIPVKLDTERNGRDAAQKYRVSSLPTVLIIDATGAVEARIQGYAPAPRFNTYLTNAIQMHQDFPKLLARYQTNSSDLDAAVRLTKAYVARGEEDKAQRSLARVAKLDPTDARRQYSKSLTAVADLYAGRGNYDEAIPLFRRVVKTAQNPEAIGYSQLSLAVCHFFRRDIGAARTELKAALVNPKVTGKYRENAKEMLAKIDEMQKKAGG